MYEDNMCCKWNTVFVCINLWGHINFICLFCTGISHRSRLRKLMRTLYWIGNTAQVCINVRGQHVLQMKHSLCLYKLMRTYKLYLFILHRYLSLLAIMRSLSQQGSTLHHSDTSKFKHFKYTCRSFSKICF